MIFTLMLWALCAPGGYLAGQVYCHKNKTSEVVIPYVAAALPPVGAVLALLVIIQAQTTEETEDE